jgi:2-polyprenyl-3-methyl-5-hydroxy-6-metoxy-1,4-benzoquinol methylase
MMRCYHCKALHSTPYAEENGYALVKCGGCGLLYVTNPPTDNDVGDTSRFNRASIPRYRTMLTDLFNGELAHKKTWLDVGCGHGEFVQTIGEIGITVRGVEPNVHKVKAAQSRGLNVAAFDITTHDGRYDVISLMDVYSHLPNPPAFLCALKRLLTPNGELLIQTGDAADLPLSDQFRPFGLPDHLSFASEAIVRQMLTTLGFQIVTVRKYSYLYRDPVSITKEVVKAFLPHRTSKLRFYLRGSPQTNMVVRARLS